MIRATHQGSSLLAVMLLIVSPILADMPLSACVPQSSPSSQTSDQKTNTPLPEAPQPQSAQTGQQETSPAGAAGAKAASVKGAPVAQPVGAAVAPVRQRGHRSLIIKLGLVAGAAVAVGTVVALSERNQTRPPGTTASTTHQ